MKVEIYGNLIVAIECATMTKAGAQLETGS